MMNLNNNLPEYWLKYFRFPKPEDNKYTRGHVLINGGDIDSTGATKLAAFGAARAGAGYVTVACEEKALPVYANSFMSIVTKPVKAMDEFFRYIEKRKVDVVLVGPGNGTGQETAEKTLECLQNKNLKMVIDADAISVFEQNKSAFIEALHGDCIITPHEGEFKRIFELGDSRADAALNAAKISGAVVVLKGHETIIAEPGGKILVNKNAPVTLATAGTGDVLAGIISALFAQGMPAFETACAGVWIHAEAANNIGGRLIADDLPAMVAGVLDELLPV